MISPIKENCICFLLISTLFAFGYSEVEYEFEVKKIHHINAKIEAKEARIRRHYFHTLNEKERRELCIAAKEFDSLDGMGTEAVVHTPDEYSVVDEKQKRDFYVVLQCETIPVSFLRLRDSDKNLNTKSDEDLDDNSNKDTTAESSKTKWEKDLDKNLDEDSTMDKDSHKKIKIPIIIMVKENEYEDYEFKIKIITYKPEPDSAGRHEEELKEGTLSNLFEENRLNICIAAKKNASKETKVVLDKSAIKEPQVFDIEKIKRVAIECPSSPPMYVFLGESENKFVAVLVKIPA